MLDFAAGSAPSSESAVTIRERAPGRGVGRRRRFALPCRAWLAPLAAFAGLSLLASKLPAEVPAIEYRAANVRVAGVDIPITVPSGYEVELLSRDLRGPRLLTFGPGQDLFAGSRSGHVYRLEAPYRQASVLVALDDYPHAVAFREGEILVARTNGLYRAPWRTGQVRLDARDLSLLAALPGGWGHNSRTVHVGPDRRVYASLGIRGNCSDEYLGEGYPFERSARRHPRARRGGGRGSAGRSSLRACAIRSASTGIRPRGRCSRATTVRTTSASSFLRSTSAALRPASFHGMPWYHFDGYPAPAGCVHRERPARGRAGAAGRDLSRP